MKVVESFNYKYGSRGKFDQTIYTLYLNDNGIYKLQKENIPREGKKFMSMSNGGEPAGSRFMPVTGMAQVQLSNPYFKEHDAHWLRYKRLYKLSNAQFFYHKYKWETERRKVYLKRHYGAMRLMDNRIEARKYSGLLPASKCTFLYIIGVGEFTKFGIADDIMNRMYDYKSEFGSYLIYDVVAYTSRKLARTIEKEMIKYLKSQKKIVRGHEYTKESPEYLKQIRDFCTDKVEAFS